MRPLSFLLLASSAFAAPAALGAVTDEDFDQLRQQLSAMSQRLDALAAENADLKRSQARAGTDVAAVRTSIAEVQNSATRSDRDSWSDSVRLDGDFRYRYEKIDVENTGGRTRNRIRARANIRADLVEDVEVGFGLATGGNDPVSTNQTIGAGGSSKNAMLNLAYADWAAGDNLHLVAGKYKNPLLRVGKQALMWDSDWTPEGLAMTYRRDWLFVNAIGTWFESDSNRANDHFSWGGQVGVQGQIGGASLKGGVTYFSIKAQGESTTFGDPGDPDDYYGNTAVEASGLACGTTPDANCTFLYDYLLTEVFAEAAFNIGSWPTFVFVDYVKNKDAPVNNTAWTMGARIGQSKDRGQMGFSYYYADKGADSMLGLVTDSDFAGGGTNNKGHFVKFTLGMNKSWFIGATYFVNEIDVNSGIKRDYNRLQIDTQWKWK
jgi:putative porin